MELRNEFRVDMPLSDAWRLLTDVERIAPCLPGAQLQEIEGEEYRGMVKVKVGPISAQYKGKATFVEQDEGAGRLVLKAAGRDTGGAGNANAVITVTLAPDGPGTKVTVVTDLAITGRLAQFGKGVLADVSANLLNQFVACLHQQLAAPAPDGVAAATGQAPAPPVPSTPPSIPVPPAPVKPPVPRRAAATLPPALAGEPEPKAAPLPAPPITAEAVPREAATTTPASGEAADTPPTEAPTDGAPVDGAVGEEPETAASPVRTVASRDVEPVDLFEAARRSLAKRALPALGGLVVLVAVVVWWRRRP